MIEVLCRSQSLRCVTHKALERSSDTAHLWSVFETLSQGLTAEWHRPSNHWPSLRRRCAFDHVNRGLTFGPPETHLGQTHRSAPTTSIKTLKYIFITLLTLVVLLYGLPAMLVHLPVVQRRLAAESGRVLSAVLRAPVRIDAQFILDAFASKDSTSTGGVDFQIRAIRLARGRVSYDVGHGQPEEGHFDAAHIRAEGILAFKKSENRNER